ncbi:unnamed protein product [Rhizoctonia solani]|uniref:Uncharacterized protein n=1 Tax=Rhizoctonia solani TaxID=456999 RepID=A0A8H2X241_9AGAM|nr:unnamed protein product [Rhizoctonia solani]
MVVLSTLGQIHFTSVEHGEFATKEGQKKPEASTVVDSRLFKTVGLKYPTTLQELQVAETQILQRLQVTLLDAFENPELGRYCKTLVFDNPPQPANKQSALSTTIDPSTEEQNATVATKSRAFYEPGNHTPQLGVTHGPSSTSDIGLATTEWIISLSSIEVHWVKTGWKLFDKGVYSQAAFCFRKADLLIEHDIATAYESRRQARLLRASPSVSRSMTCAAFTRAAEEFVGCAILSKGREQISCYLRAAECHTQTEDWAAAAGAYYLANEFNMAARAFRRAGSIDEAVEIIKNHRDNMYENVTEEIIGVARLEYFRTNQLEKASGLFDEVEEQLEYMEDYGFTGDPIHVLEHHRRYDQAAELAFTENNVVEGVRLLLLSDDPASVQKGVERAFRELWKLHPFGHAGNEQQNPIIALLMEQLSAIEVLSDDESCELEAFKALHGNDVERLFVLARSNQVATLDSDGPTPSSSILALLCFSHGLRLLALHENSTLPGFVKNAKLVLNYISQLLRFARSLDIASLHTQKLLGFELVAYSENGESELHSPEFWIHSTSPMFESAQKLSGDISSDSSALELSPLTITESDTRRLALTALHNTEALPALIPDASLNSQTVLTPSPPGARTHYMNLTQAFRIHRQNYTPKLHSSRLVRPRDDLMVESSGTAPVKYSIVHDFINFYARKTPDVISRAIRAVHHIVHKPLAIETNVFVNILEFIGREIIMQWRLHQKGNAGELVFDKLLVPRSWAFKMIERSPLPQQKGILLRDFFNVLYRALELLRSFEPSSSPLYGFNRLGLLVRSVLIMRVCRLIVLVANNVSIASLAKEEMRQAIVLSLAGPGNVHPVLCARFMGADSWHDLWNAVRYSPLNRGADELVCLFCRQEDNKLPNISAVKPIIYSNLNSELGQLLSLVEPAARPDPRANPLVPQVHHAPPEVNNNTIQIKKTTPVDQLNVGEPPDLVVLEGNLPSTSQVGPKCPLAISELESGRKILVCYRRYALRQQIKMKKAVKTIWACYLRHKLYHRSPMTATEKQIRKLHNEYKNDVKSIDCPPLYAKASRSHGRILLGFMPHALVYLRGLERINQQQKETNKKRLQKVQHAELDEIRNRMDACAALAKKIKVLARQIAPGSSALHKMDTLREEVKRVDLLRVETLNAFGEDAIPKPLEEQYSLGISVILTPPLAEVVSKLLKPELNVSYLGI